MLNINYKFGTVIKLKGIKEEYLLTKYIGSGIDENKEQYQIWRTIKEFPKSYLLQKNKRKVLLTDNKNGFEIRFYNKDLDYYKLPTR